MTATKDAWKDRDNTRPYAVHCEECNVGYTYEKGHRFSTPKERAEQWRTIHRKHNGCDMIRVLER